MNKSEFISFCNNQHDVVCNQKYDKILPYSYHLGYVAVQCHKFKHLLDSTSNSFDFDLALMGCYGHDLIEDARITYNDIIQMVGLQVAEIIYACTENKGRNRSERHSSTYYEAINDNRLAVFVKLCDIISNVQYSRLTNSSMYTKYKREYPSVKLHLSIDNQEFKPMFDHLEKLLELN